MTRWALAALVAFGACHTQPDSPDPATGDVAAEGDDRIGTFSAPIRVTALPYRDSRDIGAAPSAPALGARGCASGGGESGAGFIYQINIVAAGALTVTVHGLTGGAVAADVHLLDGASPSSCLVSGERALTYAVEPGAYFVAVGARLGGDGRALAGTYTLDLALVPPPDLDARCVVLYGDTRGRSSADPQEAHRAVAAAIARRCPDPALVHVGDFVNMGSSDADWERFIEVERVIYDQGGALYPVRGNSDGTWDNLRERVAPLLAGAFEVSHYARPLGERLTLLVLDSEGDVEAQAAWLEAELAARPGPDHRFVVASHRPLYSSVGYHPGWEPGRTQWGPIFAENAGRVLVVAGHNHGLSRELVEGVTYLTSGGGGAPLYGCTQEHADTEACVDAHGYYVCDATLACFAYAVDELGGEALVDAFAL